MAGITPSRSVEIEIDPQDTVQVEPFFAKARMRFEIRSPRLENVEQLASGVWILKPEATNLFTLHETTAGQAKAVPLSSFNHDAAIQALPLQRSHSDLTGATPSVAVSASGDNFYVKRIAAGASWDLSLTASRPAPTLPTTPNYDIDNVLEHNTGIDVADQGYVLRWIPPSHMHEYIDYVMLFRFGGPIAARGFGEFELAFGGDGRAHLYEWYDAAWNLVDEWRYAPAELVPAHAHTIRIIPHAARYMEVRSNITANVIPSFLHQNNRLTAFSGRSIALDAHVYTITNRDSLPSPGGGLGYNVTGPGHPAFRVRRDVLLRWQLARVTYPASGTLLDQAFTVPQVNTSVHTLAIRRFSMVLKDPLAGTDHGSTSATAYDANTLVALTPSSENWAFGAKTLNLQGFALPGKPNAIRVQITLTNNDGAGGPYSPWFFGYEAHKIGTNASNSGTAVLINDTHYRQSPCTRVSITGPDADPSHESASLRVCDLVDRLPRLRSRGEGRIRVTTTYDPANPTRKSVLFDGYWIKSNAQLRGMLARSYPSPNWHDYELTCMGMWKRLHERDYLATEIISFSKDIDPATPTTKGEDTPSKVTDAIRYMMVAAGIPESQLDIPDLPIRLYSNQTEGGDVILVQPGTNCADFVRHLAEDYLNYFLCWDANAGTTGMWRLKPIPRGTESSLWTFTDTLPAAGKVVTHPGSWPSNSTWIARDALFEWTVPPEGNWLRVTGEFNGNVIGSGGPGEADNPKAYNRPGANTADPNHPDYTDGRWRPIFRRHDPTLTGKTQAEAEAAVAFVTRRVFDLACRAQKFARFTCPLPLVNAAGAEPSIYPVHSYRPLMFGDVVTWRDGRKAMVRNCNVSLRKQTFMLAQIEVQFFNDPLPP